MEENVQKKNVTKQEVTPLHAPIVISRGNIGLFKKRFVGIDNLFDYVEIDNEKSYSFKYLEPTSAWYYNELISKVYHYNSIYMNFEFRNDNLPERCKKYHKLLTDEVYDYLKTKGDKVSKLKIKVITKHLIKHISRLKFHKKYAVRYTRKPTHWKNYGKNLSWVYMDKVLNYLEKQYHIKDYRGGIKNDGETICSMFIVNPDFIHTCNGRTKDVKYTPMDECLLQKDKVYLEIRDEKKLPRKPTKEEKIQVDSMEMVIKEYNNKISKRKICINGICVPEIFFRRIATVDLSKGCRWYDSDGSIQKEDATSRSSITIDDESTVEVDYSSLHFSLAAEELGLDLKGKDPYNFIFNLDVDMCEVEEWKETTGFYKEYDPVRNLKKVALLTMFNASNKDIAIRAISKAIKEDYRKKDKVKRKFVGISKIPVTKLVEALIENNPEISSYLNSGVGLRFQRLDSDMIEYCIQRFIEQDEVCIPIHDSLIVKESMKDFTVKCMEDAYEYVMGSKINCKVK